MMSSTKFGIAVVIDFLLGTGACFVHGSIVYAG